MRLAPVGFDRTRLHGAGARGYATVAPDKWAGSVRYVVNTSLYGYQTVLQHLGLELALHGKKNDYWY